MGQRVDGHGGRVREGAERGYRLRIGGTRRGKDGGTDEGWEGAEAGQGGAWQGQARVGYSKGVRSRGEMGRRGG